MSRLMKFLHELASYGLGGGAAIQLYVLWRREDPGAVPALVGDLGAWVVLPSVLVVGATGLVAMFVRPVFFSASWVWLKIFLTVPPCYVAIATVPGVSDFRPGKVGALLWISLVATVVVTALSVWRPKSRNR